MRQVASVIKDGKVQYFLADAEEGELTEFATVVVPESFAPLAAVKLGFNLIAAVGLNGHTVPAPPERRAVFQLPPERPAIGLVSSGVRPGPWDGTESAVEFVAWQPGCRIGDIYRTFHISDKAATSAVTRAVAQGRIIRGDHHKLYPPAPSTGILATPRPAVTGTPRDPSPRKAWGGAGRKKWAVTREQVVEFIRANPECGNGDLATALLGEDTRETRQTINNRIMAINNRTSPGPRLGKTYETVGAVKLVHYWVIDDVPVEAEVE